LRGRRSQATKTIAADVVVPDDVKFPHNADRLQFETEFRAIARSTPQGHSLAGVVPAAQRPLNEQARRNFGCNAGEGCSKCR